MSDEQMTTAFYKPKGVMLEVGPVPGRQSYALSVGIDGEVTRHVLAYFRKPKDAEEFKDVMRELLAGRLLRDGDA